jgi:hypothetical protein
MKEETKQGRQKANFGLQKINQLLPVVQNNDHSENALIRPEMHMFLRPYFLLDKHANRAVGFETREIVTVNGKKIERRWCVKPDDEYGMPGPIERDVLLAVYEIAYEKYISKGLPVPELMNVGSLRNFIQRMGMSYCGKTATKVKLGLKRLVHTACKSENSFFDKSKSLFLTESFHLLRGVGITGESDGKGGTIEETYVIFDERVRGNLNARYLMVIDLLLLRRLKSDIAKHLYPLLSHWLWRSSQQGYWRVEYKWLAEHLGLKVCNKIWRAKDQLRDANEELKILDYIGGYKWDDWHLIYFAGEAFQKDQERRISARENSVKEKNTAKAPTKNSSSKYYDPLVPALNLFAAGNPMAGRALQERGLTSEQAEALCLEKGIYTDFSA